MRLIILGAGGFGVTVADQARQSGKYDVIAFLDDGKTGPDVLGVCGDFARYGDGRTEMIAAFGNNAARLQWLQRIEAAGITPATLIHSSAYVSPTAAVAPGNIVMPQAVVNTHCQIKRGCIINCGAIIDHDCVIEEGVHICLGAIVKAENRVPSLAKVEAGQVIENRSYPL